MVAIGSTLCQVLTVSMSALFERHTDNVSHEMSMNRTLQMRQYPLVTEVGSNYGTNGVLSTMFRVRIHHTMSSKQTGVVVVCCAYTMCTLADIRI